MAGESPDKSEQGKPSGEAAGGERDPRLGVHRETGAAVAVAGDSGSHADQDDQGGDGNADEGSRDAKGAKGVNGSERGEDGERGTEGAGEHASASASSSSASGNSSASGKRDAKPDASSDASSSASEDGAKTGADAKPVAGDARLKAAVAAWMANTDDEGSEGASEGKAESETGKGARSGASASGASPAADASPADQPTQLIKAPAPAGQAAEPKNGGGRDGADDRPVDRPTAAFGLVRPDAGTRTAPKSDRKTDPKSTPENGPKGGANGAGRDAGKPSGSSSADQPTALLKAPVVPPEAPAGTPGAGAGQGAGQGRNSRFVPLKSDDEAPALGKKTTPGTPAASAGAPSAPARPAAPDRPAVPVKVTPPAPAARPVPGPAGPGGPERTTQTPMPVGPDGEKQAPLDLLAQLTNTPPPPETPVRTAMRRVKIWTPIVVLLLIVFCVVQAFRPLPDPSLALGKQAAYTFGGEKFDMKWPTEGQSAAKVLGVGDLGTYGPQKPVPTASMAKVMTAYVVLRDHPLKMRKGPGGQDVPEQGPAVTIDERAEKEGKAKDESAIRGLRAGQTFSEYDMLQMLLIPSGNNIARQLARWDAGSEEAFLKKMNDTAKQLGMKNTTYTDASGLNKTTVSTAVDQVLLAEQVIKDPIVRSITTKPNTPIKGLNEGINSNIDDLLIKHTGVLGIKTGSSSPAGGTLMWAARKRINGEEVLIVGATMDQHFKGGPDVNAEMSLKMVKRVSYEQLTAVQNALQQAVVVKKGQVVGYVDDQLGGKTEVVATKDVKGYGWGGMQAKFALDKKKGAVLPHSAKAGTVVGELVVGTGPDAVRVPVALKKALSEPSFGSKLTRLG
ncbi:D-alanyl-D-alanine carboxypeptidase [Streptomyces mobaraensis NBRC 13819 = DSM 40847]|uniref:Putative D-alanyl-D-alanine carboxypeptidase n=1 Tax=Streptomyces mobaraensis (strain ATCC 29032 / DSM 40847 / JCM 4168 / NBRC 13819 / NCIMB 11159 / IPCR 16-22) TaxID=1223523 RepID=M3C0J1_STRM1|nr:D-alanyl-D-alanine carboxypeptidase [Streptomyces mobaraensis]EME97461.1 putative D-alanyl-D-alanine carboxypeptidase [Streptomyces mobaraensis NBRC 13819 = DSM 40847]QTT74267.1 D-alanyl-D-alanine carboxypeptidase [Streptomyces mobaraensis NBRC 13819 = DSM 40847]